MARTTATNRHITTNLGKSVEFDGSSNAITLTDFKVSTTAFSVACWVKIRKATNFDRIIDQQDAGPTKGFTFVVEVIGSRKRINFVVRSASGVEAVIISSDLSLGTWYHLAATYEKNSAKFFVNGSQVGATDTACEMADSTAVLSVGRRCASSNWFNGFMKDLLIYNRVLSQSEITSLYYSRIIPTSPQVYLEMNNSITDSSGNGNNGTEVGTLTYTTDAPSKARTAVSTPRTAPLANYTIKKGTLLESFQTLADWTRGGAAGSIAEDTTHFTEGNKSMAVTFVSGTSVFYDKTINQIVDGGTASMMLKIYVPSLIDLGSVALYITSTTNYSKYFLKTIQATLLHEGYNYILISPSEWNNSGGESWANTMVRLRIRVNATTGTPSVSFCSIYTGQYSKPKVIITFDDSWESQYTKAYAYMATKGLKGTIYAIGSKLGTANYCTLANLQTMYSAGWDIGNHGSVNLTTLATTALQEAEIAKEEAYISEFTRSKKHYAYPNGGYDDNARTALANLGYETARTIIDRQQANVLDERYLLTRYGIYNSTSVANTKGYIDRAISQGSAILLNYHLIVDADADVSTKVLTANFNEVMDYITLKKSTGEIDVVTISEWYNGLSTTRKSV